MNEGTRIQAERAALVQRLQLDALHRALQSLEAHLAALESETDRQSDELSHLAEQIAQLRARTGLPRPSGLPASDTSEQAGNKTPEHHRTSPHETNVAPRPSPDLAAILPPPAPGENWDTYVRHVDQPPLFTNDWEARRREAASALDSRC